MFKDVLVLGAGSAGLLMALAIRRRLPGVGVRVLRSSDIGVIGVGESTTPNVPRFLYQYLGLAPRKVYELAQPTWKLGIHFLWGPRESFEYSFPAQYTLQDPRLPKANAYYCDGECGAMNIHSALMAKKRVFARRPDGSPEIDDGHAFHIENLKFVQMLETAANSLAIEFIDGKVEGVQKGPLGIAAVVLEDGRTISADFFVDASGFRRELIGRALNEPFLGYEKSLFNDRALLGSWKRGADEPILPYTTAETMSNGWSWRIDHEHVINRGYVYSSAHISDDEARREFQAANPKATVADRIVKFTTGRFDRGWIGNMVAVGNSYGFVEPLEATALMMICWQCESFCNLVKQVGVTEYVRRLYNRAFADAWDEVRDFLTLHFKVNTRLNTPYWVRCREESDCSNMRELMDFYADAGPTGFNRHNMHNRDSQFGIEGYLVQFVGNQVPYQNRHEATAEELKIVGQIRERNLAEAAEGYTVEEALATIRHPQWRWNYEMAGRGGAGKPAMAPV
jgi:tryptophan halogenase